MLYILQIFLLPATMLRRARPSRPPGARPADLHSEKIRREGAFFISILWNGQDDNPEKWGDEADSCPMMLFGLDERTIWKTPPSMRACPPYTGEDKLCADPLIFCAQNKTEVLRRYTVGIISPWAVVIFQVHYGTMALVAVRFSGHLSAGSIPCG